MLQERWQAGVAEAPWHGAKKAAGAPGAAWAPPTPRRHRNANGPPDDDQTVQNTSGRPVRSSKSLAGLGGSSSIAAKLAGRALNPPSRDVGGPPRGGTIRARGIEISALAQCEPPLWSRAWISPTGQDPTERCAVMEGGSYAKSVSCAVQGPMGPKAKSLPNAWCVRQGRCLAKRLGRDAPPRVLLAQFRACRLPARRPEKMSSSRNTHSAPAGGAYFPVVAKQNFVVGWNYGITSPRQAEPENRGEAPLPPSSPEEMLPRALFIFQVGLNMFRAGSCASLPDFAEFRAGCGMIWHVLGVCL
eukprot:3745222-Pyramimonas_sp.AAC.1